MSILRIGNKILEEKILTEKASERESLNHYGL